MNTIKFLPLSRYYHQIKNEYFDLLDEVYSQDRQFEGKYCELSEQMLCDISARKHALLCQSGTDAITIMLLASRIGPGDEVICANYSCPASVMPIMVVGATPVFVDIDEYGSMDLRQVKQKINKNTKAVLVTSLYGDSADFDQLNGLDLLILNDSAQALGNNYKGIPNTKIGDCSIASFSTNKNAVVFGTYGAVMFDDTSLKEVFQVTRRNGYLNRDVGSDIKYIGINSQPQSDKSVQVYLGLKYFDQFQQRRKDICNYYDSQFANEGITIRPRPKYSDYNYHKYSIMVKDKQQFRDAMLDRGIECQMHYTYNFSKAPVFKKSGNGYPMTEYFCDHIISLPNSPWHTDGEIEYIFNSTVEVIDKLCLRLT